MRLELEWLPLLMGCAIAGLGLALSLATAPRRGYRLLGSVLMAAGVGPALMPGHGEVVIVQAGLLLFVPHPAAVVLGLGAVLAWSAVAYLALARWARPHVVIAATRGPGGPPE